MDGNMLRVACLDSLIVIQNSDITIAHYTQLFKIITPIYSSYGN